MKKTSFISNFLSFFFFLQEAIRNSLILSIAQQLLEDRDENIRKVAIKIVALLIALISGEDKYDQVSEMCFSVLNDESAEVIKIAKELLFPSLAQWSFSNKKILSGLLFKLLCKIKKEKNLNCMCIVENLLPFVVMTVASSEALLWNPDKNECLNIDSKINFIYEFYKFLVRHFVI